MNHHLMLAQARVMKLCHAVCPGAKIGPALNPTAMYPETCRPEDAIAAHNWEVLRCWNFADVPVFGWYHPLAVRYLEDRGETEGGSLRRIPKDSFYWYRQVIAENGKNL